MEQTTAPFAPSLTALPRSEQPCDVDCAFFLALENRPEWGWCRDPQCPAHRSLTRAGRECARFLVRTGTAHR
ncbi:MAG TPA: hypothetical protein VK178_12685 [Opitutaceae bacterium]|nr:hypothetical protein [Opitutaceae bacterium]